MTSITFTGNLAGDVESRFTPSGRQVARFTVIENRRRKNDETGGVGGRRAQRPPRAGVAGSGRERGHLAQHGRSGRHRRFGSHRPVDRQGHQ